MMLIDGLPDNLVGQSIRLMLGSGMRVQELLALRPEDITVDGSKILINKAIETVNDPGRVNLSGVDWIVVGTMTGAQSRKVRTQAEWAYSLIDQAHALGIPAFMKGDLVPIVGEDSMIQEMPEAFNQVLEAQRTWQK
jgi:hypothetical protein